ncbi:phosphotransferase [Longimicrobium sp.]|uniref:phosphotransferase n=1 Tax=Longimicrobium sp. TaxID=2029185 RepID=UPI003B3B9DB7
MPHPIPPALIRIFEDPYDVILSDGILATADPAVIHRALAAFCAAHLGSGLAEVPYVTFSVGAGFGIVLEDGRRAFLKAWSAANSGAALDAIHTVQHALAEQGFPAPRVLVRPAPFMGGRASVMEWMEDGAQEDANRPELRRTMAAALARQIALAQPYVDLPGLPRHGYPDGREWGPTHNALFDFRTTAAGAEWIDDIAVAAARAAREGEGRRVLGHRDWRVQNMRFQDGRVSAVFDWDSLTVALEPEIVGMAAATFPKTDEIPLERVLPSPESMAAFIADYEAATGRAFTPGEMRTAGAAATHLLAYTARCEHCYGPRTEPESAAGILRAYTTADPGNILAGLS